MKSISIWLILLFSLVLRLPFLGGSFWLDEAAQALESVRPLSEQLQIQGDFQPPLFHLLVHFFSGVSHAEWWLRLASLIPALITIYFVYKIGGKFPALLMATSQLHIFYSQELRPYSLATMFAVLSMYYFLKLIKPSPNPIPYILVTTLGMYSVYTFPFLILAQVIYVLIFNKSKLKFVSWNLFLVSLLCLPWLPSFWAQFQTGMNVTQDLPLWKTAVSPPPIKALLLVAPKFIFGRLDLPDNVQKLIPLALIIFAFTLIVLSAKNNKNFKFLAVWLLLPVLFGFLISFKVPLLDPKRFLFCLPALYLLISLAKSKLRYSLFIINCLTIFFYWFNPNFQREPWRQAVAEVEARLTPTTTLVFPWVSPYAPWVWYAHSSPRAITFSESQVTPTVVNQNLASITKTNSLIYFDYLESITDPGVLIRNQLTLLGWNQASFVQYPVIGQIRLYSRSPLYALQ